MKKRRGLRRYYRNLGNTFNPNSLDLQGENAWFDLYHVHIDNHGLGNTSWRSRKQHLDALFSIAAKIEMKLKELDKSFQFWLEIYDHDSYDDAVYIHTENPNDSEFPVSIDFDENVVITNTKLKSYLDSKEYAIRTKYLIEDDKKVVGYFLQKNGVGLPIEK